jgi:hypothetical protein
MTRPLEICLPKWSGTCIALYFTRSTSARQTGQYVKAFLNSGGKRGWGAGLGVKVTVRNLNFYGMMLLFWLNG